jgi:hypothetical protein
MGNVSIFTDKFRIEADLSAASDIVTARLHSVGIDDNVFGQWLHVSSVWALGER